MRVQVDHHAATLHAAFAPCSRCRARAPTRSSAAAVPRRRRRRRAELGPTTSCAGAIAVVVDRLRHAVAVGVEHLADMGQAVPLRRVLQVQDRHVVADDVGAIGVRRPNSRIVHVRPAVAQRRPQHRRMAARVEHVAAGIVERQAQAEGQAFVDLGDALAAPSPASAGSAGRAGRRDRSRPSSSLRAVVSSVLASCHRSWWC